MSVESEESLNAKQQAAQPPRARTLTNFVEPTKAEWVEFCRGINSTWQLIDIERAYNAARAGGWTRSRGGKIRDWKAHAETCNGVWLGSRAGQEATRAAKRAEPSPEMIQRLERAAKAEEMRKANAAAAPKIEAGAGRGKAAELMALFGGGKK